MIKNEDPLPTAFQLLGHVYTVKVVPRPDWKYSDENLGFCDNTKQLIEIQDGLTPSQRWHSFWHEFLHAALHVMSSESGYDEAFVDLLAGLIHQATSGSKVDIPRRRV
jgi:hypothetical protein